MKQNSDRGQRVISARLTKALKPLEGYTLFCPVQNSVSSCLYLPSRDVQEPEKVTTDCLPPGPLYVSYYCDKNKNELKQEFPSYRMVRDLGLIESPKYFRQEERVIDEAEGEYVVAFRSLPWSRVLPFILKLLLLMKKGTLFIDLPPFGSEYFLPVSVCLRDLGEKMREHWLYPHKEVRCMPCLRFSSLDQQSTRLAPQFVEVERIRLEMELMPFLGVAFVEEGASFLPVSERFCLEKALSSKRSISAVLKQEMRWGDEEDVIREQALFQLEQLFWMRRGQVESKEWQRLNDIILSESVRCEKDQFFMCR